MQASFALKHCELDSWLIQQLPTSHLFYAWQCVGFNATLSSSHSLLPPPQCPQIHSLCLHLYFYPANRSISPILLQRMHILNSSDRATFSWTLSDMLHLTSLQPSISTSFAAKLLTEHMPLVVLISLIHSFLTPSNLVPALVIPEK